ncbi:MAG: response regulator [Burkholderiales bacterium]|nr:response regulator [Burkholderiales bacterium]
MLSYLGYMSELAKDGEEAIKLYKNAREAKAPFDAVILDLFIENCIGGRETLNALRRIDPDVKAIISSGNPHDPIIIDYKEHGFAGALSKPFKAGELDKLLKQTLDV